MSTIAVCVFPAPSVVTSALTLARRLRDRGHCVWIMSTPDVEPLARLAGVEFAPVLSGLFRSGSFVGEVDRISKLSRFAALRELRQSTRLYKSIIDRLVASRDNEIDHAFNLINPDLVLFYSDTPSLIVGALAALRRGLPCAYVTPFFCSYEGPGSPPLSFENVPRPGFWGRLAGRLVWAYYFPLRNFHKRINYTLGVDINLAPYLKKLAPARGQPGWPVNWRCFLAPKLSLPEFFLAPRDLEFDFQPREGSHWLGWHIAHSRTEDNFPFDRLDPSRPLVYCAMGTLFLRYAPLKRRIAFLQAVVDALAARPHLQLALATGGALEGRELTPSAPGAIILDRMPQLQLLSRAGIMITHCGLHTLMECASEGVSMIAFPLAFDQPGNSARILYHGLGLRADFRRATPRSIGLLIDSILADTAMSQRCAAMSQRSKRAEFDESEILAMESLARSNHPST